MTAGADAVVEISGRDSIAAALRFAEDERVRTLLPSYVHTGTEYGDFSGIEESVSTLRRRLADERGVVLADLVVRSSPELWWAMNGRFASLVIERFGFYNPCVGCHLYLHLMRAPLAKESGATAIVSGERERHGTRIKLNQTGAALDAYSVVLDSVGLRLLFPLRHVADEAEVDDLLDGDWADGVPQLDCVLAGNYRGLDGEGCLDDARNAAYLASYVVPVGHRLAAALQGDDDDYVAVVEDVLRTSRR